MIVAKWFAPGDIQLLVKRISGVHYIQIMSNSWVMDTENAQTKYIFNDKKKYFFCINKDCVELHEE